MLGHRGATQSVYVQFIESNNVWTLVDSSGAGPFSFSSPVVSIPDGTTHSFGSLFPGDSSYYRGLHAFQEADDEWQWIYQSTPYTNGCWSPFESTCRTLTIHWQSDSTLGTKWNSSGAYLLAGSPDTLDELSMAPTPGSSFRSAFPSEGASAYVTKPIDVAEFLRTVGELLPTPRSASTPADVG